MRFWHGVSGISHALSSERSAQSKNHFLKIVSNILFEINISSKICYNLSFTFITAMSWYHWKISLNTIYLYPMPVSNILQTLSKYLRDYRHHGKKKAYKTCVVQFKTIKYWILIHKKLPLPLPAMLLSVSISFYIFIKLSNEAEPVFYRRNICQSKIMFCDLWMNI